MAKTQRKTITIPIDDFRFLEFLKRGIEIQIKRKLSWGEYLRTLVPPGVLYVLGSPITDELLKEKKEELPKIFEAMKKIEEKDKKLVGKEVKK